MTKEIKNALRAIDFNNRRHVEAVGARALFQGIRENGLGGKTMARACIKMQTYY